MQGNSRIVTQGLFSEATINSNMDLFSLAAESISNLIVETNDKNLLGEQKLRMRLAFVIHKVVESNTITIGIVALRNNIDLLKKSYSDLLEIVAERPTNIAHFHGTGEQMDYEIVRSAIALILSKILAEGLSNYY